MKNLLILVFFFFFILPISLAAQEADFIDGISIHGIEVSGLSSWEAEQKLSPYIQDILEQEIIIQSPDKNQIWVSTYEGMGIKVNLEKAINEGLAQGREGFILKKWWKRMLIKKDGYQIPLQLEIQKTIFTQEVLGMTIDLVKIPQDAKLKITSQNKVVIEPDILGIDIDTERMLKELEEILKLQGPLRIMVQTKEAKARITVDDLKEMQIETMYGQFTTWFNPQKKNRTLNIKMAAQAIDDYLLAPGEEFSFNKIVGPRTKEAGYNEAPIILNNQFVEGVGGGVCQVSSTLYNVLLRSNLTITERHPHSLPVRYVPKGMDAAVVYGLKDLKFKNNTEGHILIKTYVGQGSLTIKLFGREKDNHDIEVISTVEKTFVPKTIVKNKEDLLVGQVIVEQNGIEGYLVRVERIIRDKNQKVLVHEILSRDYYPPVDKVILMANS